MTDTFQKVLATTAVFALLDCASAWAEDWAERSFKVINEGKMTMAYPLSWGKKPSYELGESVANIRFGPYGPKSKPIFLVDILAVVAVDPVDEATLKNVTEQDVEFFRQTAFETEIPINDFNGPNSFGHYFSITDSESKHGEFDYVTTGVVAADRLLVKFYFFSSDGAPDFGADAMQVMRSVSYTPPPPEEEPE